MTIIHIKIPPICSMFMQHSVSKGPHSVVMFMQHSTPLHLHYPDGNWKVKELCFQMLQSYKNLQTLKLSIHPFHKIINNV